MDPIVIAIVVLVVIALALGGLALRRGKGQALPPEARKEERPEIAPPPEEAGPEIPPPAETPPPTAPSEEAAPPPEAAAPAPEPVAPAAPEEPAEAPTEQDVEELKKGLASTRGGFISRLAKLFGKRPEIDPALLDEIEEVLITADIGVQTTQKVLGHLRERMDAGELTDTDAVWAAIREEAKEILERGAGRLAIGSRPSVILVVGVNGVGKTTTIGKLASHLAERGKKVVLAAGDTFRAAAVLQLEVWGRRVGCDVVQGKEKADPGSVIFDAVKKAQAEGADVVIADTAGRLHTKTPLMDELKKVGRTVEKALGRPADETLLVLDATTGQNAIQQAQMFRDALPVSGLVLTKLDGTAKGGVILGIVDQHGVPVRYVGIGERVQDLREFDPETFVNALFEKPDDETLAA
ncbi:MAG: signal recognition particle-docking protein FtsY [Myxococcota bacterium]